MKLTFDQIRSLTHGAFCFDEKADGGLTPRRFTRPQLKTYRADQPDALRPRATSGVSIECRTDAAALELSYRCYPGSSRDVYGFDLMVDGLLHAHREGSVAKEPEGVWTVTLPAGEKCIRLLFPCLAEAEIMSLTLTGATFFDPLTHERTLLFMGDSITQGYTTHFPSLAYPAQIALNEDAAWVNQAIGGEVFRPEILDEEINFVPSLIVLAYGTNDWSGKEKPVFLKNATDFIRKIRGIWPDVPMAVLSPIWRGDYLTRRGEDFPFFDVHAALEDIASKYANTYIVDGFNLVPHASELMEDEPLHPNELGFIYYAKRLSSELKKLGLL